jgi:hypothetical protein
MSGFIVFAITTHTMVSIDIRTPSNFTRALAPLEIT